MLESIVLYLLLCLSYITAYFLFDNIKGQRIWVLSLGLIPVTMISSFTQDDSSQLPVYLLAAFFTLLALYGRFVVRLKYFILVFLVNDCMTGLWECILLWVQSDDNSSHTQSLLPDFLSLITLITVLMVKLFNTKMVKNRSHDYSKSVFLIHFLYYTVIFMAIGMLFTIANLRHTLELITSPAFQTITIITIFVSYLSIGGMSIIYSYISSTDIKMREMLQQEQMMNTMQQQYYVALLEKEADTRRFRHDISNHIISINQMAKDGDTQGIIDYIASLNTSLSQIKTSVANTGNTLVDTITNYYISLLPKNTIVSVRGIIPDVLPCDNYLFNTIYSNVLQNAIEAILSDTRYRVELRLDIWFSLSTEYLRFVIKNTYDPSSHKVYLRENSSKESHGFGMVNARSAADKLNGSISHEKDEKLFITTVVIPI